MSVWYSFVEKNLPEVFSLIVWNIVSQTLQINFLRIKNKKWIDAWVNVGKNKYARQ